jgi:hypothetical protein
MTSLGDIDNDEMAAVARDMDVDDPPVSGSAASSSSSSSSGRKTARTGAAPAVATKSDRLSLLPSDALGVVRDSLPVRDLGALNRVNRALRASGREDPVTMQRIAHAKAVADFERSIEIAESGEFTQLPAALRFIMAADAIVERYRRRVRDHARRRAAIKAMVTELLVECDRPYRGAVIRREKRRLLFSNCYNPLRSRIAGSVLYKCSDTILRPFETVVNTASGPDYSEAVYELVYNHLHRQSWFPDPPRWYQVVTGTGSLETLLTADLQWAPTPSTEVPDVLLPRGSPAVITALDQCLFGVNRVSPFGDVPGLYLYARSGLFGKYMEITNVLITSDPFVFYTVLRLDDGSLLPEEAWHVYVDPVRGTVSYCADAKRVIGVKTRRLHDVSRFLAIPEVQALLPVPLPQPDDAMQ